MAELANTSLPGTSASFAALRVAHSENLQRLSARRWSGGEADRVAEIRLFIQNARGSGKQISDETERRYAQGILDYWSAELIASASADATDWTVQRLDACESVSVAKSMPLTQDELPRGPNSSSPPRVDDDPGIIKSEAALTPPRSVTPSITATAASQIRLAAIARQWLDNGRSDGYLLGGEALKEARRYRDNDRDIEKLVAASEAHVARRTRLFWMGSATVLLGVTGALALRLNSAMTERNVMELQLATTKATLDWALKGYAQVDRNEVNIASLGDAVVDNSTAATQRLEQLRQTKQQLDQALDFIRQQQASGRIHAPLPDGLAQMLVEQGSLETVADSPALAVAGYDADFLGPVLPLPSLQPASQAGAFRNGAALDYYNYSLVFSTQRRYALLSASTMDRQKLRVLPQPPVAFRADEQIVPAQPAHSQLEPGWFVPPANVPATWVDRQEVAWGQNLHEQDGVAAQQLAAFLNFYTNAMPLRDEAAAQTWRQLQQWVVAEHNKGASKVAIFSGPVIRDDDPVVDGIALPQQFWKVAVSLPLDRGDAFVVDAFVIPTDAAALAADGFYLASTSAASQRSKNSPDCASPTPCAAQRPPPRKPRRAASARSSPAKWNSSTRRKRPRAPRPHSRSSTCCAMPACPTRNASKWSARWWTRSRRSPPMRAV